MTTPHSPTHTKTPWRRGEFARSEIVDHDGTPILEVFGRGLARDADVDFILRAVNAHDDLVAACRMAMEAECIDYDQIEDAIRKAEA